MLDFVYSSRKRQELEDILFSYHPNHNQRIYFISFLNSCCNLNKKDIDRLIKNHSNWDDFCEETTDKHTASLCHEPRTFLSGDFSLVTDHSNDKPQYRKCCDTSIFSRLNTDFFDLPDKTAYEYEPQKYNIYGTMQWNASVYPIYRTIEGKGHLLFYIDVDGSIEDIDLCWKTAKDIFALDSWDFFKFSGSKGFHLCKKIKNTTRHELKERAKEIYNTVKTNLVGFGTANQINKPVLIDTTAYNLHRFVRGFAKNYKGGYSYPITTDMNATEIVDISKDLNRIGDLLK